MRISVSQRQIARAVLTGRGIARLTELRGAGVTAATVSRMKRDGEVLQLARGLYQLPDAPVGIHHDFAEAAKKFPKGVFCLGSALAFHGLTGQRPEQLWLAIGQKDWPPKADGRPLRLVRFTERLLFTGVESHVVDGVMVRVFSVAKTVADCFRYRNKIGLSVAVEALQEALRQGKATPAEIAQEADRVAVARAIRPFLEALTANG